MVMTQMVTKYAGYLRKRERGKEGFTKEFTMGTKQLVLTKKSGGQGTRFVGRGAKGESVEGK